MMKMIPGALLVVLLSGCASAVVTTASPDPVPSAEVVVDGPGFVVEPSAVPDDVWASSLDGYEYSDTPQGAMEQALFDEYPELWEQGVRAVTDVTQWVWASGHGEDGVSTTYDPLPSATVRYYDGVRYEGTDESPLGAATPGNDPSVFDRGLVYGSTIGENDASDAKYTGYYAVWVNRGAPRTLKDGRIVASKFSIEVVYHGSEDTPSMGPYNGDSSLLFDSADEVVEFFKANGGIKTKDGRLLNPGEVGLVIFADASADTDSGWEGQTLALDTWELSPWTSTYNAVSGPQ